MQAKRGVRLQGDLPPDLPCVLGDTGRLIQIFHNLIGNACKFTHHGTITISAHHKMDEVRRAPACFLAGAWAPPCRQMGWSEASSAFKAAQSVPLSALRVCGMLRGPRESRLCMWQVEISVADTGIGIPDDKFDAIFQAFEQVRSHARQLLHLCEAGFLPWARQRPTHLPAPLPAPRRAVVGPNRWT